MKKKYSEKELVDVSKKAKQFKQWIDEMVDDIINHGLLIDFVDIEKYYVKDFGEKSDCVFTMNYKKKYRMGTLSIYPTAFRLFTEGKMEELTTGLFHELCHLHSIPVAELARNRFASEDELMDAFEELTQTMAEYLKRYMSK